MTKSIGNGQWYTARAVTNGKTVYYSVLKSKHSGVVFYKFNLKTGKSTRLLSMSTGLHLVAYKNGWIYFNRKIEDTFVFSRFNVNSKNLLIVQKDFWAEKWNQKNVISGWKASDPEQKIMKIKI